MLASVSRLFQNRPTMPDHEPEIETSTASLLSADKWYPIVSSASFFGKNETTFWISEQPEEFLKPLDQSEAQCYRVDFTPELHSVDGASVIGRIATLSPETRIQILIIDRFAYLGNRTIMDARREAEYQLSYDAMIADIFNNPEPTY